MDYKWFTNPETLRTTQYASDKNLSARIYVHQNYSTNPVDYPIWIFDQMLKDFPTDANIIEFGCGNGLIWQANQHRIPDQWKITLTDLSQGMLDDAKQNLGKLVDRITFQVLDVQNILFPDNQFDAVIANFMLYHVPDRSKAIKEIRRILKDDGVLHSVTLGIKHMKEFHQLIESVIPRYSWTHSNLDFNAENAQEQLSLHFQTVETLAYESNLRVTEATPLVNYLASTARVEQVKDSELNQFNNKVTQIIANHGAFFIQKDVVLFKSQGYAS